jgi:hypothetical protein
VVFVGGELCIPFLALSGRVSFKQYQSLCADNRLVCLELVKKARMRGTKLLLPVDILSADEAIDAQLRRRCFDKFDADSRDEGADYNGEIKSVLVGYPENGPLAEEYTLVGPLKDYPQLEHYSVPKVSVEGFVYDIGEQSRKVLQEQLANCDLLVSWGPLGACEVSGFQMGQRTLVQGSVLPPRPEEAVAAPAYNNPGYANKPLHTWVIGDSSAEWFSRYADPDGEQQGDLVEAGRLSFVSRASKLAVGVLGRNKLAILGRVNRCTERSDGDWRINDKKQLYPEEEDEEDEED